MSMKQYSDPQENVIEWITGSDTITCFFTQRKYITKVRKIVEKRPFLGANFHENKDGSIVCHLPLKALKLSLKSAFIKGVDFVDLDEDDEDDEDGEV